MKKVVLIFLCFALLQSVSPFTYAYGESGSVPQPPSKTNEPSGNRGPLGEGAGLGEGSWILVTLVIGYGVHTFTSRRKDQDIDLEE